MPSISSVLSAVRVRRPAELCACPVCGRRVTSGDERLRLRGQVYAHRNCATYRVRQAHRSRAPSA